MKSISRAIRGGRVEEPQCRHEPTTDALPAETGAHRSSIVPAATRVVGWRVPDAFFGERENLLLRLRYEGWHSHVHADVRASQVRQPLLGQLVPEEKSLS